MKRSRLTRRVGLKPTQPPTRRVRLKPISDKRRALMAKAKPFRDAYLAKHLVCEACLKRVPQDVHEITRGPHREKALDKEYAVLALCRPCHDEMDDYAVWPVSRQLALKIVRSPELFGLNVKRINQLRGWSENEFEIRDVFVHLSVT